MTEATTTVRHHHAGLRAIASSIAAHHHQIDLEARIFDPTGQGRCCKRTCRACGAETFGSRSMFEEIPESRVCSCGSSDVEIAEASYPRHTEETLRVHVARDFGDRGRFLFAAAQRYLRRCTRPQRTPRGRARSRARCSRPTGHRPTATTGDPDGEPPSRRRSPRSSSGRAAC